MKQKFKKWIFSLIISTFVIYISILFVFNLVIDIDHIFHFKEINQGRLSGDIRYGKIQYLEKHYKEYNSYIIGGSRSGIIQGKSIEPYIKNSKYYNLSLTFNNIRDSYRLVKYIIDHYNVKNILLQISTADFQPTVSLNQKDHFKISGKNSLSYYLSYFFTLDIQHTLQLSESQKQFSNYFFRPTNADGSWDHKEIEEKISRNPSDFFASNIKKQKKSELVKQIYSDSTLNLLVLIKNYCKLHEVNLFVYYVPDNHSYLDLFDKDSLIVFLRKVSKITDFWYFSGYNSITANDTNYYDIIHYRHFVSDLIINKMFSDSISKPLDFGTYITASNSDQHLGINKQ